VRLAHPFVQSAEDSENMKGLWLDSVLFHKHMHKAEENLAAIPALLCFTLQ
jgi:hypothetical protein